MGREGAAHGRAVDFTAITAVGRIGAGGDSGSKRRGSEVHRPQDGESFFMPAVIRAGGDERVAGSLVVVAQEMKIEDS